MIPPNERLRAEKERQEASNAFDEAAKQQLRDAAKEREERTGVKLELTTVTY